MDFIGFSTLPYGLPQVDWIELAPNAATAASESAPFQSEFSTSVSFSPEVKLSFEGLSSVYEAPEEVEKFDSISRAISEAQTVISRSNTAKVPDPRNEWDPFFAKYEEQMRWFDVLNDERTYGISMQCFHIYIYLVKI